MHQQLVIAKKTATNHCYWGKTSVNNKWNKVNIIYETRAAVYTRGIDRRTAKYTGEENIKGITAFSNDTYAPPYLLRLNLATSLDIYSSFYYFKADNPCDKNKCMNNATCMAGNYSTYTCLCIPGWTGVHCEMDINECQSTPCGNNGNCTDQLNNFTCNCQPGFTGRTCDVDIDDCRNDTCFNHGVCEDLPNDYKCLCPAGYTGKRWVSAYRYLSFIETFGKRINNLRLFLTFLYLKLQDWHQWMFRKPLSQQRYMCRRHSLVWMSVQIRLRRRPLCKRDGRMYFHALS